MNNTGTIIVAHKPTIIDCLKGDNPNLPNFILILFSNLNLTLNIANKTQKAAIIIPIEKSVQVANKHTFLNKKILKITTMRVIIL